MKMAASSAATSADGSWKEPMHGSGKFADCWFVTSICSPFTTPSFTSRASGSHSGGIFETSSRAERMNQMMPSIKQIVKDNMARFSFYRTGNMFYTVDVEGQKYQFPVSLED